MRQVAILIFLITAVLNAQIPAEITLVDGSTFMGFADITKKDEIEFRISTEDDPETLDGLDLKRVTFIEAPSETFEYVYLKNRFKLLKVVAEGKIIAYAQYPESFSTQKSEGQKRREDHINQDKKIFGNGRSTYSNGSFNMRQRRYWIKKAGYDVVDDIKLNFRKEAKVWFSDCPGLLKKIKSKEFTYSDMINVVNYYNDYCTEI